jgi:hypothetical protein
MTGRVAHGRPFIFWFSDLARQRHIQEPASLPESFILESSSKDCLKNGARGRGHLPCAGIGTELGALLPYYPCAFCGCAGRPICI